ncbi:hypothetical protein B0H11DRAFT_2186195 [Mycena galericulata]|nr:hypothetical protein B0H11DRAFT_2186195 [Mycena galericulata]
MSSRPSPRPAYGIPQRYEHNNPIDLSSSPSQVPPLRPVSRSPTLSELEVDTFGHRVTTGHEWGGSTLPSLFSVDPQSQARHSSDFPSRSHTGDFEPSDDSPFESDDHGYVPHTQSVFSAVPGGKPKSTRAKRTDVAPAPLELNDPDDPEQFDFEIVIHSMPPEKKPGRGRTRVPKVKPVTFGPITANTVITWPEFLDMLAEQLGTMAAFLVVSSFEWRWLKPANSAFLPVRANSGLLSLLNKIRSPPKGVPERYIIIKMEQPVKQPAKRQLPWVAHESSAGLSSNLVQAVDDGSDDDDLPKKKAPFDDGLQEEMDKISERYPPGTCSLHPDIECFHSRVTNLHFELDRTKKIIWAAAIKNGTASILTAPSGSQHFNIKSALKAKKSTAPDGASAGPSAGVNLAPAAPPQSFLPQFPFYPNPYAYPTPPQMGYPPQFPSYPPPPPSHHLYNHSRTSSWHQTPSRTQGYRRERSWDGSSPPSQPHSKRRRADPEPPSSPGVVGGSIDDFCGQNPGLPEETKGFLVDLGFEIGEDLSLINEPRWEAAGFTLFGWNRVIKAYNKYKRSLRG